jgi:hypothetical protein
MRVPAIFAIQKPSDVPKDSDAWRAMVLDDEDYISVQKDLKSADTAITSAKARISRKGALRQRQ